MCTRGREASGSGSRDLRAEPGCTGLVVIMPHVPNNAVPLAALCAPGAAPPPKFTAPS